MKTLKGLLRAFLSLVLVSMAVQTFGRGALSVQVQDTVKNSDIKFFLENSPNLLYPLSTGRIYEKNGYTALWFSPSSSGEEVWNALLLLDCAIQYGLDHHVYHASELTYSNLKDLADHKDMRQAARLDILLTDAMLAFINHLHYGKLNPVFTPDKIDAPGFKGLKADSILTKALQSQSFSSLIEGVQPTYKGYEGLQRMLRLMTGQYLGDSYETSAETVKLISVNLERWRWEKPENKVYVSINIPAFTLHYNQGEDYREFKVIAGKPSTPTPVLSSGIDYFITAPDWTVPQRILLKEFLPLALTYPDYFSNNNFTIYDRMGNTVGDDPVNLRLMRSNIANYIVKQSPGCDNAFGRIAFNFPNNYHIYLHDTPDRSLFNKTERAFSNGCIGLEDSEEFAKLLLKADSAPEKAFAELHRAMKKYKRKQFTLNTPVPIMVGYFTCEMKDGLLVSYKDLYLKDRDIADGLFGSDELFVNEIKEFIKKKTEGFSYGRPPVVQK